MKKIALFCVVGWLTLPNAMQAQVIDTVVHVGNGQRLHFSIIQGKSTPILFESGLGDGADVWNSITQQIADATGATVITYDRLSNTNHRQHYSIGIENETIALENALKQLGYSNKKMMLVAHSLGGMYCSYYASRHPKDVKAVVFIDDANICSLTAYFNAVGSTENDSMANYLADVLHVVEKNQMPEHIPLTDIVAETRFDDNGNPDTVWFSCHKRFVEQSPARKLLLAYNVGHSIFTDNPPLVINTILTQYATFVEPKQKVTLLEKGLALSTEMINQGKKNEVKCGHSEDDLITWGYSLLEKNETEKAIEVFKLNVLLHPDGWNNYDSLGEAYLKAGNKISAIENYEKSLELNPGNDNAIKILDQIK